MSDAVQIRTYPDRVEIVPGPARGEPGLDAYDEWLALGNSGTRAQFIASLNGAVDGLGAVLAGEDGADAVGFKAAGADAVATTAAALLEAGAHTPLNYGGTGDTAMTRVFAAANSSRGIIQLPRGSLSMAAGKALSKQGASLRGMGRGCTTLNIITTADDQVGVTLDEAEVGYFRDVMDLTIVGANATHRKTLLRLLDSANCDIHRLFLADEHPQSIGLLLLGRQVLNIFQFKAAMARPCVIGPNPVAGRLDLAADMSTFLGWEIGGTSTSFPALEIQSGAWISNTNFMGLAVQGGRSGVEWNNDDADVASALGVHFHQFRSEQALVDSAGEWDFNVNWTAGGVQSLSFQCGYFGGDDGGVQSPRRGGFRARKTQRLSFYDCTFTQRPGRAAIDFLGEPGSYVTFDNCLFLGGEFLMTNMRQVSGDPEFSAGTPGTISGVWRYDPPRTGSTLNFDNMIPTLRGGRKVWEFDRTLLAGSTTLNVGDVPLASIERALLLECRSENGAGSWLFPRGGGAPVEIHAPTGVWSTASVSAKIRPSASTYAQLIAASLAADTPVSIRVTI